MNKNIITLIGPSGTGKTTNGKLLSLMNNTNFNDGDDDLLQNIDLETAKKFLNKLNLQHIEAILIVNETVANIKNILGDENFLKLENYLTLNHKFKNGEIYASSGSLPLIDESMVFLKQIGKIIYIEPFNHNIEDNIILGIKLNRIVGMPKNIMKLSDKEKIKLYKQIMGKRDEKYKKYADEIYKRKKHNVYITNKNNIEILSSNGKKQIDIQKEIKFHFDDFYKFLKEKGIVKI